MWSKCYSNHINEQNSGNVKRGTFFPLYLSMFSILSTTALYYYNEVIIRFYGILLNRKKDIWLVWCTKIVLKYIHSTSLETYIEL